MPLSPRTLRPSSTFTPKSISGLALWLDGSDTNSLYTTDAGAVTAVSSPTEISGCALWLDASDTSTITQSGGLVSQWNDKSGNGRHAFSTGANRPTTGTRTVNGRNAIDYTPFSTGVTGNYMWLSPTSGLPAPATHTVFMVVQLDTLTLPSAATDFMTLLAAPTLARQEIRITSNGSSTLGIDFNTNVQRITTSTGIGSAGTPLVVTLRESATPLVRSAGAGLAYSGGGTPTGLDWVVTDGSKGVFIGSRGYGHSVDGLFCEVLIYSSPLSDADTSRVEAYLAAKWGISGVHVPVSQELTAVSSPLDIGGCAGWWDASRTDKMWSATSSGSLVANGGAVLRLEDLSGNGKHLIQATSTSAPLRQDGAKNGLPVLNFAGTKSLAAGAAGDWNFLHNTQGGTVIAVIKPFDTADPQTFAYGVSTNVGGATNQVGWASFFDDRPAYPRNNYVSHSVTAGVSGQTVISQEQNNALSSVNDFSLFSFTPFAGSSTTAGRAAMYVSGASVGSVNSSTLAPTAANSNNALTVGVAGVNSIAGLAELIVFSTVLSAVDRARVEKYLQQKWATPAVPDPTPPVGAWLDKSRGGRHSVQSTAANRPAYQPSGMNSKPALTFDTTKSLLSSASIADLVGSAAVSPAVTVAFVAFSPSAAAGFSAGSDNAANGRLAFQLPFDTSGNSYFDVAGTGSGRLGPFAITSSSQVQPSVYVLQRNGTSMYVRRNGAVLASKSDALQTFSATSAKLQIGQAVGLTGFQSTLSEFLCYSAGLTSGQVASIERSLAKKYGITLAPQVSNADAQDWINRVYANGGTVTSATASAVNTFCNAIDAAGVRDRFLRLNLFCGTGLNACLVPLYRGRYTYTGRNLLATVPTAAQFSGASWVNNFGAGTANQEKGAIVAAPDGSLTAQTITFANAGAVRYTPAWTANATGTISFWVRRPASGGATHIRITTNNTSAWNTGISEKFALTTSWQRISTTGVLSTGSSVHIIVGGNTVSGLSDSDCNGAVELWSPQVEYGSLSAYEGPQYGNATDINNFFASTDYSESNGLQATASGSGTATKYLDSGTGIIAALPNSYSGHISACFKLLSTPDATQQIVQTFSDNNTSEVYFTQYRLSFNISAPTTLEHIVAGVQQVNRSGIAVGQRHIVIANRPDQNSLSAFIGGGAEVTNSSAISTSRTLLATARLGWFGNINGTGVVSPSFKHVLSSYSFGLALTNAQAVAINAAMQAFNQELGRT